MNIWTVNAHAECYSSYHDFEMKGGGFCTGKGVYDLILYSAAVKHLHSSIFREVWSTFRMGKLTPELLFKVKVQSTTIINGTEKYEYFVHFILPFDDFIG